MESVAATATRLAAIDSQIFATPLADSTTLPQRTFNATKQEFKALPASAQAASVGLHMLIKPDFEIRSPKALQETKNTSISDDVQELAQRAKITNKKNAALIHEWRSSIPVPDAEVVTLGTGSAAPSKYRNVSATLLRVPGYGSYLLDCGENTLGQLQRVFKPQEVVEILKDLRMIWISHLHADHHLGTVNLIKAWYSVVHGSNPSIPPASFAQLNAAANRISGCSTCVPYLSVVSNGTAMHQFLAEHAAVEDFGYSHVFPLSLSTANENQAYWRENKDRSTLYYVPDNILASPKSGSAIAEYLYVPLLGLEDIQGVHVKHCIGATAVALTFPPTTSGANFKAAYSGDCRPSADFAHIGQGASVLIHEATFDDELQTEAEAKHHCTTGEALKVAVAMDAKAVVLTHFSQRYQKIPVMETVDGEARQREAVMAELERVEQRESRDGGVDDAAAMAEQNGATAVDRISTETEAVVKIPGSKMKVCVAFDYMRVKVGDVARFEALTPALVRLFEEKEEKEELQDDGGIADARPRTPSEGTPLSKKKEKKARRAVGKSGDGGKSGIDAGS
jgi:ribonuclease Z